MKNLKTYLLALLALVLLAPVAIAQTYPNVTTVGTSANRLFIARGIYTSATTTAAGVDITPNSTKPVVLVLRASATSSATVTNELKDGTVLNSQVYSVTTTPQSITYSAPVYFEVVRVSVTTAQTGTNSVSATILQ